jgi:hypothetical protein
LPGRSAEKRSLPPDPSPLYHLGVWGDVPAICHKGRRGPADPLAPSSAAKPQLFRAFAPRALCATSLWDGKPRSLIAGPSKAWPADRSMITERNDTLSRRGRPCFVHQLWFRPLGKLPLDYRRSPPRNHGRAPSGWPW